MIRVLSRPTKSAGFTLIELLVAIAIFSVISVAAYNGLRNIIATATIAEAQEKELIENLAAVTVIENDLLNIVPRSIRDELGDRVAALSKGQADQLELTRKLPGIPPEFSRVDLKRVDYIFRDNALWRRSWAVLDRLPSTDSQEQRLLSGLSGVSWEFYSGGWQSFWPSNDGPVGLEQVPKAMRVKLEFENGRHIERVVLINNEA